MSLYCTKGLGLERGSKPFMAGTEPFNSLQACRRKGGGDVLHVRRRADALLVSKRPMM